jgi:hypothetical protein
MILKYFFLLLAIVTANAQAELDVFPVVHRQRDAVQLRKV